LRALVACGWFGISVGLAEALHSAADCWPAQERPGQQRSGFFSLFGAITYVLCRGLKTIKSWKALARRSAGVGNCCCSLDYPEAGGFGPVLAHAEQVPQYI